MKTLPYSFTLIINVQGKDMAAAIKKKKITPKILSLKLIWAGDCACVAK